MRFKHSGKRVISLLTASVISVVMVTSCSDKSQEKSNSKSKDLIPFSLGYLPSTGHLLYFVAKEEGFFEDEGLDVSLSNFDGNTDIVMSVARRTRTGSKAGTGQGC